MQPWSFTSHDALAPWRAQILSEIEAARKAVAELVPPPALGAKVINNSHMTTEQTSNIIIEEVRKRLAEQNGAKV